MSATYGIWKARSQMNDQPPDNPGVVILPAILLLATVAAGIALDWLVPIGLAAALPTVVGMVVGTILFLLGSSTPVVARRSFDEAGTNIRPDMPTTALITSGVFAHSRNPIYQGALVAVVGVALIFTSDWIFILLVPALVVLHYGVVLREERYLERKFGEAYRRYKATVPRYGWKF
jgi:protein-S-isoprenylcysteine O-methyltransferase Ste14